MKTLKLHRNTVAVRNSTISEKFTFVVAVPQKVDCLKIWCFIFLGRPAGAR